MICDFKNYKNIYQNEGFMHAVVYQNLSPATKTCTCKNMWIKITEFIVIRFNTFKIR